MSARRGFRALNAMGDDDSENGQSALLPRSLSMGKVSCVTELDRRGWGLEREGLFYIKLATFRKWTFQSLLTMDPTSGTYHVVRSNLAVPQRIRCPTQQDVQCALFFSGLHFEHLTFCGLLGFFAGISAPLLN